MATYSCGKKAKAILIIITIALVAFAFIHSSMSADISSEESGNVLEFLQKILDFLGFTPELTDHIVRKSAHFCEYTAIGAMLMSCAFAFDKLKPYKYYINVMFCGLATAVCDETIQLNVEGRAGMITDVRMENVKENKMGIMPMTKLILTMSLPAIFSMTIMAMYNVVDSIFIGQYSQEGLNATSLAYPLQMLLIAVAVGTGVGINSLVSRRLGEKNFKEANEVATHGLLLSFFSYAIFLVLGIVISRPFMMLYTTNENIIEYGTQYLTVVLCFSLFAIIEVTIEKTLQATGNMIFPMLFQLTGAVINIIFDPLLIFGIGPFPELGVTGAAVATVFGQFCSMIFALLIIFLKSHLIKITFRKFKFSMKTVKNIYAVGFPSIIMQSIGSIMIVGLNGILAASEASVTVLGVYYKLQSFVFMPCFGLNQGVMPIIGYNYGARNRKRVYSALKRGIIIGVIIMTLGTLAMWIIPEQLISMFGGTEELMKIGVPAFRIISLCFIPAAAGIIFTTLFQAVGKGMRSLIMSFARQLVLILPIAFIFSRIWGIGAVWYAFPIAEIFSLTIAICFFINLVKGDFKKLG